MIKGSEMIKGWEKVSGDIWEKEIDDSYFENTNLFKEEVKGYWFFPEGKNYHTGLVYLNGVWMKEAQDKKELDELNKETPLWFVKNDDKKNAFAYPCACSLQRLRVIYLEVGRTHRSR